MIQSVSSSKISNSKGVFSNSKSTTFKGNLANEAIGITKKITKELPPVKKSLIAAVSDLIHIIGDGQGVIRVPLDEVSVVKETILDANNIIVPHITDLAGDIVQEGASAAGHEATGAIIESAGTTIKEHAGHGLIEGANEFFKEIFTNL